MTASTGGAPPLVVNARFSRVRQTGVQRVATELSQRLSTERLLLSPARLATGFGGYFWEQVLLPPQLDGRLLWSPCNVGPVTVRRQIVTIHDAAVIDHPEWFSPAFVLACRSIWRRLVHTVRQIVTVSAFSRSRLALAFDIPEHRIEVVPNGVSEAFRPRPEAEVAQALSELSLANAPYFATLSSLEPRKNLRLVLQAWERARGRLPAGAKLLVIGARGAQQVFAGDAGSPGLAEGVVELGYVPDALLPPLLSGALGVLYPSFYEGFGLPLLEAMACGAPVATTCNSSLPEVAGRAAIYVDAHDCEDLARAMIQMAESRSLREEMSERSIERAAHFSWRKSAEQFDQILTRHI